MTLLSCLSMRAGAMWVPGPHCTRRIDADGQGNVVRGDVIAEDSSGCYFYAESRLVSAVGMKDHVS